MSGFAPSSVALILGRSISGLGGAGIEAGAITIIVGTIPLSKRPTYQGFLSCTHAVAAVTGPLSVFPSAVYYEHNTADANNYQVSGAS